MTARDNRRVIAAVDGRPGSAGALRYAVGESVRGGSSLHLVHVWPSYLPRDLFPVAASADPQTEGRSVLERATEAARRLAPGLEISTELVVGPRAAGILSAARGGRLLVVGRPPRLHTDLPLGGTPASVATRASSPIVVVPSHWTGERSRGVIVVGMQSQTGAPELLSHSFEIAHRRGVRMVVVRAWELHDPIMDRAEARFHSAEWQTEGVRVLEGLVEAWRHRYPAVPVELRVVHGRAATALVHVAAEADLLLVARPRHALPPYGRLGGTARTLLRTGRCPVEVVPVGVVAGAPELTLVPSGRASRPSRRSPRRDVLAVHDTEPPAPTAPGSTARRTSWS